MIKLFCCDVDGTMTDGSVYMDADGVEAKRFCARDGAGFHRLKQACPDIKIAFITSEKKGPNYMRFLKLHELGTVEYFCDNAEGKGKVSMIECLCEQDGITFDQVAFIGDDTNDLEAMRHVSRFGGEVFCPADASEELDTFITQHEHIHGKPMRLKTRGGYGAVREACEILIKINGGAK